MGLIEANNGRGRQMIILNIGNVMVTGRNRTFYRQA